MANDVVVDIKSAVGGGYKAFWASRKRYRVLKGGKASKKSSTTALNFIYRLMRYPESNLLVVRRVMDTHRSSTFAQLRWAIRRLGLEPLWRSTTAPMEITYLPTGQKIFFRGLDDAQKLASITVDNGYLCWVWIEEAFEIEDESEFDLLDLSVPRGQMPEHLFKQTTITFNPWSEKHWLKKRFFDTPSDLVDAFTTNYLCNEFLSPEDIQVYEEMKVNNPRKYDVAGLGNWGIADGLIYENWVVEKFDKDELPEQWKYRHCFGLDYGYTNDPTAFIAFMANPIDKLLYIYDEHYEKRMLNDAIAAMIKKKGYAKERIRSDCAEPKSNDDLRRLGIQRIIPAEKGKDSINHGIDVLQQYRLIVHPSCTNTIAELSSYVWGKDKDGSGINKPVDRDNHLMDALRYAIQDIKFFRPEPDAGNKWKRNAGGGYIYTGRGEITPDDFAGGWS